VSTKLRSFLQYTIILAVTVALTWYSLNAIPVTEGQNKWDYIKHTWQSANKGWLLAMALVAIVSHIIRAERWKMLLAPSGYQVKFKHSFYSLMVGYLVNLVIPRGGEVSRCYNLYKLEKVPAEMSFGTVVVERIIDLLCLLVLLSISFALESKKLFEFINTLPISTSGNSSKLKLLLYVLGLVLFGIAVLILLIKKNQRIRAFILKTWSGFKDGLLSVFRLKNKWLFILYSAGIWFFYFLMSYTVIMAFPSTSELGLGAVLSLFAIGAIAMAAPLPGGTGSYHVLVPQGLVFLYQVPKADAVAFTFIFHGWQTILMIVIGAISLLITSYLVKKKSLSH